jgi:hypothetical protein
MNKKEKEKWEIEKWLRNNGCADFDTKTRDIILYDGGLMSIEPYTQQLPRICGKKKLPNGCVELIFTKKKYPHICYKGTLWFEELDETIAWMQRARKLLQRLGYQTGKKKNVK